MAVITQQELEDAATDAKSLEDVVNGSDTFDGTGIVTTRLGQSVKTLSKVITDLSNEDVGASAAALINQKFIGLASQIFIDGRVYWNPLTRTISFPTVVSRTRDVGTNTIYSPATTFDIQFSSSGNSLLYFDMAVAAGSNNPFVAVENTAVPLDEYKIPVAVYRANRIIPFIDMDLQFSNRPGLEIQHVSASKPIIYVDKDHYGVTVGTWMIHNSFRFRNNGISTSLALGNTLSTAVDPTGRFYWADYYEVAGGFASANSLYVDISDSTAKCVTSTTAISGDAGGYVPLAMYKDGTISSLNGCEVKKVSQEVRDEPEIYFAERTVLNPQTHVMSFKKSAWKIPSKLGDGVNINTPATTYDITLSPSGAQVIVYDTTVAAGSNPYVVRDFDTKYDYDDTQIVLGYYWLKTLVNVKLGNVQLTTEVDRNVQHLISNYPIIFINEGDTSFGITPGTNGTWMVPINTRYRFIGVDLISTNDGTPSAATDPTGTYDWSNYTQVDVEHNAGSTLYLDPGANLVYEAPNNETISGTGSGYVPMATRHYSNGELQTTCGIRAFYAGQDPLTLFTRVSQNEADIAANAEAVSIPVLLSNGEKLRKFNKKLSVIKNGGSEVIKIASCFCDSWWDRNYSGDELLSRFSDDGIAMGSSGYISLNPHWPQSNGVTLKNGDGTTDPDGGAYPWDVDDGSDGASSQALLSGSGNALSTIGNDQTLLISNIKGSSIYLTYEDLNGIFEYQINGGSWTTVVGGSTGNAIRLQIASGLSGSANTVGVRTTLNTGTVRLLDMYADGPDTGVQYSKMGNGSTTADDAVLWLNAMKRELTAMDIDVGIFAYGVNDQRQGKDPATFKTLMESLVAGFFQALPDATLLLVCPPRCVNDGDSGTSPMQDFGSAYQSVYYDNDAVEIVRLDKLWGDYAMESADPSTFASDGAHLNVGNGYKRYIGSFYDHMMKRYA